jgi:ABC-type branched-subunit amino acid transport system substrate-binding protein
MSIRKKLSLTQLLPITLVAISLSSAQHASAQNKYDPGASDTEIKIGNTMPYSGPLSTNGIVGKTEEAYFKMINDQGGINGRKINFISYDDAYSPPKTVEQARKLVESDEVLLIFSPLGAPSNTAIRKYLNTKKVPQLFVATGADKFNDPKEFPWTMGFQPNYRVEARIFAKYILANKSDARIAVFYQNDDFGKDYLAGLKDIIGDKWSKLVAAEESYEVSEPTIDSHILNLKASGANVLVNASTPKFAAQSIKKMGEIGWRPMHILTDVSTSLATVMKPAGLEYGEDIISALYFKDPSDDRWSKDEGMEVFYKFIGKYMPTANRDNALIAHGYAVSQAMVRVLQQCGNDLTRDNVMKQAANLKDFASDTLIPGIKINTSPMDYAPIEQLQMMRFKNGKWDMFGDVISAETGG